MPPLSGPKTWQLLRENDAVPPGLQIKLDLSMGEQWAWLIQDDNSGGAFAGMAVHATAGAPVVLGNPPSKDTEHEEGNKEDVQAQSKPKRDNK